MKILILLLTAMSFIACGKKPETETTPAPAADPGKTVYLEKGCVTCHGPDGKGDGPVGGALKPKPRNFSDATWKKGTDLASVITTISTGLPGTGMAPYKGTLTDAEIKAVAEYVRKLGGKN